MDNLVRMGKVRYLGCSNMPAWKLCQAIWTSKVNNLESFSVTEDWYNLIHRNHEAELIPCCETYGVGFIPYRPLAVGFLTDEFDPEKPIPTGSRMAEQSAIMKIVAAEAEASRDKIKKLHSFAKERGHNIAELAIAWLLSHPWLTTVIAGATTSEQVSANVANASWKLTTQEIEQLNLIST